MSNDEQDMSRYGFNKLEISLVTLYECVRCRALTTREGMRWHDQWHHQHDVAQGDA
jgi:hypothetical protein